MLTELKIDQEFQNKIPPMHIEDFNGLREDILRDGYVRDPLTVWKEENILLDGHHRWEIIQENPEVLENKYTIDYRSFPDRYACIAWICANQIHRHNITEPQRDYLIKEEYEARRKTQGKNNQYVQGKSEKGENRHIQFESLVDGSQIDVVQKLGEPATRVAIAKEHNIPVFAVKTAVEVGRGIDRAEEVEPGIKAEILSGSLKAKMKDLANLRKIQNDTEVKQRINAIRNNKSTKKHAPKKKEHIDIANNPHHEYTEQDAIDEIIVMGDEFISKMERMLRIRSKVTMRSKTIANLIEQVSDRVLNLKGEIKCQ